MGKSAELSKTSLHPESPGLVFVIPLLILNRSTLDVDERVFQQCEVGICATKTCGCDKVHNMGGVEIHYGLERIFSGYDDDVDLFVGSRVFEPMNGLDGGGVGIHVWTESHGLCKDEVVVDCKFHGENECLGARDKYVQVARDEGIWE